MTSYNGTPDELVDQFQQFYGRYYNDELGELAQNYPSERAFYVDWEDLYQYEADLADNLLSQGDTIREYAEEALAKYDLPVDLSFNQVEFRPTNISDDYTFSVGDYRTRHLGNLLAIEGRVVSCGEVKPLAEEAAFECPRCGTLTHLPQTGYDMRKPIECQACEREPDFNLNQDQSELVDYREFTLEATDSNLEDPPTLDAMVKRGLVDMVGPDDYLTAVGVYNAKSQNDSTVLETYVDVWNIEKDVNGKTDALSASELQAKITEYVEENEGGDSFGVPREDVVTDLGEKYSQRAQDIETQIDNLIEDESSAIDDMAGGKKLMHQ